MMLLSHGLFISILLASCFESQGFVFRCNHHPRILPLQTKRLLPSSVLFEQQQRSRRELLTNALTGASSSLLITSFSLTTNLSADAAAASSSSTALNEPLADLPMTRLTLPKNGLGREYVVIQLNIGGQGPFDFMVDSGLTTEMITPHLRDILLKIQGSSGGNSKIRGLAAGGKGQETDLVELKNASLCCGKFPNNGSYYSSSSSSSQSLPSLPLPPLHAIVTDFPQEHIDPNHDVEGMIGMELLELFDVDFDFPNGRIRFWPPMTSPKENLVRIPAAVLNESGLEGIRVRSPQQKVAQQPMLGIIDCGASFSTVNLAAADLLGLSRDPKDYRSSSSVMGMGIDGKPMVMPTAKVQFTFSGNAVRSPSSGALIFENPPSSFKPWDEITVAVGDLPVFSDLLGDGKNPYPIPTVLIGLDLLSQRRIILETSQGRARNIYVAPE